MLREPFPKHSNESFQNITAGNGNLFEAQLRNENLVKTEQFNENFIRADIFAKNLFRKITTERDFSNPDYLARTF